MESPFVVVFFGFIFINDSNENELSRNLSLSNDKLHNLS